MTWSLVPSFAKRTSRGRKTNRPPQRSLLGIEFLEDRCVPNATFTVTNLSGDPNLMGSLPNEVAAANAAGGTNTVVFQHGLTGQIDLTKTLQVGKPTGSVTIEGAGAQIQITGVTAGNLLQTNGIVFLDDLTITGAHGSGVYNPAGANSLTITNSTLSLNSTNNYGGGVDNRAVLFMVNDTVAFNHANKGGGISNGAGATAANATLINCTIANNSVGGNAADGGGIFNNNTATLNMVNSILYNPNSGAATPFDVAGTINNAQANQFFSNQGNIANNLGGNAFGSNPNLGPLQNNGGPTDTMIPGSPIKGVSSSIIGSIPTTDQRGIARGAGVTIGAVQSSQPGGGASNGGGGPGSTNGGGGQGSTPPTLLKPFLLAFLDELFHGVETVNSNGTETVTESFFGSPLFVSIYDSSGHLSSVTFDGMNVTSYFLGL
jgi:hypothetical protein